MTNFWKDKIEKNLDKFEEIKILFLNANGGAPLKDNRITYTLPLSTFARVITSLTAVIDDLCKKHIISIHKVFTDDDRKAQYVVYQKRGAK